MKYVSSFIPSLYCKPMRHSSFLKWPRAEQYPKKNCGVWPERDIEGISMVTGICNKVCY